LYTPCILDCALRFSNKNFYLSKKKKKPVDGWTEKIHHKPDAVNLQNIYAGPQDALITFTHMNDN
jgi:hypothetical protein